jgi:glucose dehydrogenase
MDGLTRPGDNLYSVSLVALDAETGKLRWHYQQVPHDLWGYDVASPPVLFATNLGGKQIQAVGQASKTGWFYAHDRATGALLYKSEPFVPHENIFTPPTPEGVKIAPGAGGGASWSPVAYNPETGFLYVAALHMPTLYTVHLTPGDGETPPRRYTSTKPTDDPRWGTLSAIDAKTGRIAWQNKVEQPLIGGVVTTKGGLVFMGEGGGRFDAFHAMTGELLWQFQTEAGVNAPPIAYEIDGTEYVAVAAGGNPLFGYKSGDELLVFALPQ